MPSYQYPFNERIRTFLRIENLFAKVLTNIDGGHQHHHHNALLALLQILDVVDRPDLKSELMQEISRQKVAMEALQGNPEISANILNNLLNDIDAVADALRTESAKLGQALRENEWLMSIKQRTSIPGGVCEFDLPSYHFWLALDESQRKHDLNSWLNQLTPMYDTIVVILRILRGSGKTTQLLAPNGVYQQMLGSSKPAQMLQIIIPDHANYFPEVSANKYAININFNSLDFTRKAQKHDQDVNFSLTICNL